MSTIMNKLFIYTAAVLSALVMTTSCAKLFEDINRPGGKTNDEEMNRDGWALMSQIQALENQAFPEQENTYQMNVDLIGNYCARYMTHTQPKWTTNFVRMNAPEGWLSYPYRDCLPKVSTAMRELGLRVEKDNPFYCWAQIIHASVMLRLTDTYGPFPIADDGSYASQKEVYYFLLDNLDHATGILGPMVQADPSLTMGVPAKDLVYAGKMAQWVRYANSLKLRIAVRMRFADPAKAQAVAEAAVQSGVITANEDNCTIGFMPNGQYKTSVEWGDSRACADIESYLTGYNDPRLTLYFKPTATAGPRAVIGCPASASIGDNPTAKGLYSAANVESSTRGVWMTAAEMFFCRAEGALAGWSMGGSAKELYEDGIRASFAQWGASGADIYLADATSLQANYVNADGGYGRSAYPRVSTITIAWAEGDSDERKLERIITQKWLALFPCGDEGWNEIRRTGYPQVFTLSPASVTGAQIPNRVPFDPKEAVNNRENYQAAVQLLGGADDYLTKMWWQR